MLFRFLVEGHGPKLFMQVVVVDAATDREARAAASRYLAADGAVLVGYDEEETAVIDASVTLSTWPRPANDLGIVAVSGRVWYDPGLATVTPTRRLGMGPAVLWAAFLLVQIASLATYHWLWMVKWWEEAQLWLFAFALVLGAGIVIVRGFRLRAVALVVVAILVGQRQQLLGYLARLVWHYNGFAP